MEEYLLIEKEKSEFQKLLNQWKHQFDIKILWMDLKFFKKDNLYLYCGLIKRKTKNK